MEKCHSFPVNGILHRHSSTGGSNIAMEARGFCRENNADTGEEGRDVDAGCPCARGDIGTAGERERVNDNRRFWLGCAVVLGRLSGSEDTVPLEGGLMRLRGLSLPGLDLENALPRAVGGGSSSSDSSELTAESELEKRVSEPAEPTQELFVALTWMFRPGSLYSSPSLAEWRMVGSIQ